MSSTTQQPADHLYETSSCRTYKATPSPSTSHAATNSRGKHPGAERPPQTGLLSQPTCTESGQREVRKLPREVEDRLHIETTATLTPPVGQFVINVVLQLAGIAAVIVFGIITIQALKAARQAIFEARVANQLAIIQICTEGEDVPKLCAQLRGNEPALFPGEVTSLFTAHLSPPVPTSTHVDAVSRGTLPFENHFTTTSPTAISTESASTRSPRRRPHRTNSNAAPASHTAIAGIPNQHVDHARHRDRITKAPNKVSKIMVGIFTLVACTFLVVIAVCITVCVRRKHKQSCALPPKTAASLGQSSMQRIGEDRPRDDEPAGYRNSDHADFRQPVKAFTRWKRLFRTLFLESTVDSKR